MAQVDINRSGEMEVFVHVFDHGGFSAAARSLCMTPSAVSKLIGRLEARLGTQLFHRSTRKLTLTEEGQRFYQSSVRVLADLDEAERCAMVDTAPRGRVVINASVSFGTHVLLPLLPLLLAQYPHLNVDIALTDRVVDLMDEKADVAVRWGELPSSDLVARRLGETGLAIVASPAYLKQHGTPRKPQDLAAHARLDFSIRRRAPHWPLMVDGRRVDVPVQGRIRAADGETLRHLALAGVGMVRLSLYHVGADLNAGTLVRVLEKFNPHEVAPIHAVYLGKAGRLPPRVRAVLDFLAAHVGVDPRFN